MKKTEYPAALAEALGISLEESGEWISAGGTVEVSWHHLVGEALDVRYEPTKEHHMRRLLDALGVPWDADRYSSSLTDSGGGGNLKREAYEDLFEAVLTSDFGRTRAKLNFGVSEPTWDGLPETVLRAIRVRRGQARFRASLLAAYDGRCAITGSTAVSVLEAAHILPFADGGHPVVQNGMLLRADVHTLFDLGEIAVDPAGFQIRVHERLAGTEYAGLHLLKLNLPDKEALWPDMEALAARVLAG